MPTPSSHDHGDRATKRSRVAAKSRIPLRIRGSEREDIKIHAAAAAASLASSVDSAGHSSYGRASSNATTISSDSDANDEPEVQVCHNEDDDLDRTSGTPDDDDDDDGQSGSEDDDSVPPEQHQETRQSSCPETEHQANLLAAPEDSRHLYLEYYKSVHGDVRTETDEKNDDYWQWDKERQQWFHEDAHARSVVWFLG